MTLMNVSDSETQTEVMARSAPGVKFSADDGFFHELRYRVKRYFEESGLRERDCPRMYLKTAIVLTWLAASYILLVFVAEAWWLALPLAVSLGLSMAAVGFNVQHDGGHHAYSDHRWINKLAALTLDLLGGSSYVWARKHNSIHHSFANITGHDDDIDLSVLGRLTPHQPRLRFHRLQHLYLWVVYGLLPVKWQLLTDFRHVVLGRIGVHRFPRPKGWDLAVLIGGKVVFFVLAFGIPLMLHSFLSVLLIYLAVAYVQGVILSVVFQLAHCVEEAEFPVPREDTGRMETAWAVHQVETTVDFARQSRLVSWFTGGLNFQIEHHLFPQICHVHYAKLAQLVESTCREFGLRYAEHKTLLSGVVSHFRWLRRMGMKDVVPPGAAV
jgi:linoleoyl-CoA desaturase